MQLSKLKEISNILGYRKQTDLTTGSIGWGLLYLAVPLVITNLLQTAYNLADTIWVGRYSTDALAALSFAFPMVFLFISFGLGVSIAGSVLVAQRLGSDNTEGAEKAASQTLTYSLLLSILLGVIGYFTVDSIVRAFGASEAVAPLATEYMQVISIGLPFLFGFTVFSALSRGTSDTVTPMLIMAVSVAINIFIDPILIFGFTDNPLFVWSNLTGLQSTLHNITGYTGTGIKGAAYATVFARALAFSTGVYFMFYTSRSAPVSLQKMWPELSELKELVSIGVYSSIETVGRSISVNLMLLIVGVFATPIVAGYGIGVRVFSIVFLPAIAVSQSVETMTGHNYGANNQNRIKKINSLSAKWMFGILTLLAILIWTFAEPIASVFSNDQKVIQVTEQFIKIVAPTFGFTGILKTYTGGFRGVGKTLIAAIIAVGTLAILRLPVAYALSELFGSIGVWYSFAISNILGAILAIGLFKYIIKQA